LRTRLFLRALATVGVFAATTVLTAPGASADTDQTVCHDASLARTRTEVDTDLAVQQFDPALGTLLEVTVNGPSIHLDTDAQFESIAATPVVFSEHMDYQVAVTAPGGLGSPPALSGSIQRIASQALAAFDGTLDFAGPSAVTQPSTARDDSAATAASTDTSTLAAFTGTGTMPFHLASTISETFAGGGGNVQAQINTFMSAAVQVCYRYSPPVVIDTPPTLPQTPPPPATPPTAPTPTRVLAFTGRATAPLTVVAFVLIVVGIAMTRRGRARRPQLEA